MAPKQVSKSRKFEPTLPALPELTTLTIPDQARTEPVSDTLDAKAYVPPTLHEQRAKRAANGAAALMKQSRVAVDIATNVGRQLKQKQEEHDLKARRDADEVATLIREMGISVDVGDQLKYEVVVLKARKDAAEAAVLIADHKRKYAERVEEEKKKQQWEVETVTQADADEVLALIQQMQVKD